MSEDNPRDDEPTGDEPTSHEDSDSSEHDEPELPEGVPDPSAFGIDPEEMMRNPIGAAFKMLSNPEAMKAFEGFMSTPAAQKLLGQGMNSPMFQQMMSNNPMLQKMTEQAAQGGGGFPGMDLGGLFGGMGAPQQPADTSYEEPDDEDDEGALDEPVLDLLTSPHGGPAWPESASVRSFDELLAEMPEAARDRVIEIAETRATHHLGAKGIERLQSLADQKGLTRAVDLLVSQGAFMGEVAWYSIVKLEDEIEPWRFAALARHALSCVTQPAGYRVPSFVNQLLAFLVDLDEARPEDLRHAVWSLSGQPVDGTDGVFEITWEDVDDLIGELSGASSDDDDHEPPEPRLMAALITALVGWRELDLSERPRGFDQLIDSLPGGQRKPVLEVLAELVGGNHELEGLRGTHLGGDLRRAIAERATHDLGADRMLGIVEGHWQLEPPVDAWMGVLHALDVLFHDAGAERRSAFFQRATTSDDTALRHLAYRVAAAWEPHVWLERASEDSDPAIRQWAEEESSTLR